MFDRIVHFWVPLMFVAVCVLAVMPRTSGVVIRFVVDLLHRF